MASYGFCPFGCHAGAGAGFLPTHLGRERLPAPALHALVALVCVQPACREGWEPRELHCVSYPHALSPPTHSLPYPLPARRSSGGWAPASHKAWHLANDPSWPPTQGLWRAEIMGPTQHWPLLILFPEVLECLSWKGPGSSASTAPWCTDRRRAQGLQSLPGLAVPWADTGLELGAPEAHRAPSGSHLRQS